MEIVGDPVSPSEFILPTSEDGSHCGRSGSVFMSAGKINFIGAAGAIEIVTST